MKINTKDLQLNELIEKEWIITNGIGGYSSSTIIGMNTRKYHGLLVAPLTPPARRHLILSKIDESIEVEDKKYNLYSNMCENYISEGYKYLFEFERDYIPIFTYKVKDITVKKLICMDYGKNTVCVLYKIENKGKQAKLTLTPIINFRDFHTLSTDVEFNIQQRINDKKVKININNNRNEPIYFYASDGTYVEYENNTFRNMYYIEEEKRGFYPKENLNVPRKL